MSAPRLGEILEAAHVRLLGGARGDEILLELAELAARLGWAADAKALLARLLEREALGSTAVGDAIAIPHAKVEGLEGVRVALGISHPGVPFGARDGRATHLFFLVLSSPRSPSQHIQALAQVSRAAKAPGLAERLSAAGDPEAAVRLLRLAEEGER